MTEERSNLPAFEQRLAAAWPPDDWRRFPVLAAVSGGADSTALLRGLVALRKREAASGPPEAGPLIVAHLNHGLRGVESDEDQRFVESMCHDMGLACEIGHGAEFGLKAGASLVEEAARRARYEFLTTVARRHAARYVATAHTADDQAETVLHRVLRGAGLAGLAGIPRLRTLAEGVTLVRPLLDITRRAVEDYLTELGQTWRRDRTNLETDRTRNRIRNELLPELRKKYNPHVDDALRRLAENAAELSGDTAARAAELLESALTAARDGGGDPPATTPATEITLHAPTLAAAPRYLVREALVQLWRRAGWPQQGMSHEHWSALVEMAQAEMAQPYVAAGEPSRSLPGGVQARRAAERLVIER